MLRAVEEAHVVVVQLAADAGDNSPLRWLCNVEGAHDWQVGTSYNVYQHSTWRVLLVQQIYSCAVCRAWHAQVDKVPSAMAHPPFNA